MSHHAGYADKRAAILEATLTLLARDGYDALTMDGVVGEAAISKGTLYHYWESKESLVEAALHAARADLVGEVVAGVRAVASQGPAARLDALLAVARPWAGGRSGAARDLAGVLLRTPGFEHLQVRMHTGLVADLTVEVTPILVAGAADGTFRLADPGATAELVVALALAARVRMVTLDDDGGAAARATAATRWSDALLTMVERSVGLAGGALTRDDAAVIAGSWS